MNPVIILIACALGVIPAVIARDKGRSLALWWLYGTALFVVALPHSLLLSSDQATVDAVQVEAGGRKCPYCAEIVRREAVVCRYCGRDIPRVEPPAVTTLIGYAELESKYESWRSSRTPAALTEFASDLHLTVRDNGWLVSEDSIRAAFGEANGIAEFEDVVRRL